MTLNNLGNVQRDLNELEAARDSYDEVLAICRELAGTGRTSTGPTWPRRSTTWATSSVT